MPDQEYLLPARVSVIVVAYRAGLLKCCLRALRAASPPGLVSEVVAVLNEGTADEATALESGFPGVRVERTAVNRGLAGAANLGRSLVSGELLLLLHDDSEIEPGFLEALLAAADAHPEAGAFGGKMLEPDGGLQSAGAVLWRDGTTSPPWSGAQPSPAAFAAGRAVDYVGTAAMLLRARTWDKIGGLDERFYPGYYIDVDAAMAVRAAGEVVWYEPAARCRHRRVASSSRRFRAFLIEKNRALFLAKWGAALDLQESHADGGVEAVMRAIARAEARARDPAAAGAARARPQRPASAASDAQYVARELALQREFAAHLQVELVAAEEELEKARSSAAESVALRDALAELPALRERAATLARIERLRWWRLYLRILPLLRRARRLQREEGTGSG